MGLMAVGVGTGLALKTQGLVDDLYANGYDPGKESSRESYTTWGWVSYGVGAAALITGTTLYLLGRTDRRNYSFTQVSIIPSSGSTGGVVLLHGGL
jgi:hypothetical protein